MRCNFPRLSALVCVSLSLVVHANAAPPTQPPRLVSIEPKGMLVPDCSLPGEARADDAHPGNGSGIQLSRDRWLIVYQTRGWRGVDDERSIVYQLRRDAPDGPLLKEAYLTRTRNDWDVMGDGSRCVKQHGHAVVGGLPKGALVDGQPAANANLFFAKWRVLGVPLDPRTNAVTRDRDGRYRARTQAVEWIQFRLNNDSSDIEIVQPPMVMRQKGFETGEAFCSAKGVAWMNQTFVPPVPLNRDCTEWADVNHFDGGRIAATKLTYNAETHRYDWTETGPLAGGGEQLLSEASLARAGDRWVVAARTSGKLRGAAWSVTADPFKQLGPFTVGKEPASDSPITVFGCGDGVLRIFTGDATVSPHRRGRDPLYGWDVAIGAEGVSVSNRSEVFDSVKQGLAFRRETSPRVDFAILFPPQGNRQVLAYRVSPRSYNFPYDGRPEIPAINAQEKALCGLYYSVLTYEGKLAGPPWTFE